MKKKNTFVQTNRVFFFAPPPPPPAAQVPQRHKLYSHVGQFACAASGVHSVCRTQVASAGTSSGTSASPCAGTSAAAAQGTSTFVMCVGGGQKKKPCKRKRDFFF